MKILTLSALLFCLVFGVRANVSAARPAEPTKLAVDVTINTFLAHSRTLISGAEYTVERCLELVGKHCAQWSTVIYRVSTPFASFAFGADAHTRYRFTVTHRFMYCVGGCLKVIDIGTEPITLAYFFVPGENAQVNRTHPKTEFQLAILSLANRKTSCCISQKEFSDVF